MIKIENDKIYMTAGEACYIMGVSGGGLYADYFGRRIELEDDIAALCGTGVNKEFQPQISANGKALEFEYTGAHILDWKPHRASAIDGGKTLVAEFGSKGGKVKAELYYTPYSRGGFSRRVVITNNSNGNIEVGTVNAMRLSGRSALIYISDDGDIIKEDKVKSGAPISVDNFIAAEFSHGTYGFLSVYGDGLLTAHDRGGVLCVDCDECGPVTVEAGESYMSPEVLAVFSDNGTDGMSRIFHDILREAPGGRFLKDRRPIVLFCPPIDGGKINSAVKGAGELGCDVFAVDIGATELATLKITSAACKAAGLKHGVKLDPFRITEKSAVFGGNCVKNSDGTYSCDLASDGGTAELLALIERAVRLCDIEYLMIDLPRGGIQRYAHGVYHIRHALREIFGDELDVEWGIVPDKLRYGRLLCYPPCMMRSAVELTNGLKAAFDKATVGCLSYSLDPTEVTDEIKRAVRAQVFSYQDDAPTVMLGDVYRTRSTAGDECIISVTKDKAKAYVVCERKDKSVPARIMLNGLDEHNIYRVRELDKTFSGAALIYCGVPLIKADTVCLHIRQVADYE